MFGYSHIVMSFLYLLLSSHAGCEFTCSNDFTDEQGVLKVMVGARGTDVPPGNVISATVGLVYINLQPEYELPSWTPFGQFRKLGKIGVGGTALPSHL